MSQLWCKELTHLKRPWWWERLKARAEGDERGWDGWMASLTRWTGVWVSSGSWWRTGRPGVLQSMGSQRVRHNWVTELNWFKKKKNLFIMAARVFVVTCRLSLVVVHGLLIAVASLFEALGYVSSVVVALRLSWPVACGIFPSQGSPESPALTGRFLTSGLPGKSHAHCF